MLRTYCAVSLCGSDTLQVLWKENQYEVRVEGPGCRRHLHRHRNCYRLRHRHGLRHCRRWGRLETPLDLDLTSRR